MGLIRLPGLQVGARGAAIDFLFYQEAADGTRSAQPLTDALEDECFALFRKPRKQGDGQAWIVRKPLVIADADAGRARYVTEDGFLDQAGDWFAQGFVTFDGTPTSFIPSAVIVLKIRHNLRPFVPVPTVEPDAVEIATTIPNVSLG